MKLNYNQEEGWGGGGYMYDPFLLLVFDFHDGFVDVMVFRKNKIL